MSDRILAFRFGDRVRVMQTDDMVKAGLANLRGTVSMSPQTIANDVEVNLDDTGNGEAWVHLPASVLMKE